MNLLTPRFFVLPAAALAVIVALAQGQDGGQVREPTVNRPGACTMLGVAEAPCVVADSGAGATVVR